MGNALTVTSDRKILVDDALTFLYYEADIYSLTDYYPFDLQVRIQMTTDGALAIYSRGAQ